MDDNKKVKIRKVTITGCDGRKEDINVGVDAENDRIIIHGESWSINAIISLIVGHQKQAKELHRPRMRRVA